MRSNARAKVMALGMVAVLAQGCAGTPPPPEIVITAKDFKYSRDHLALKAGQPVRLTLINPDAVEHDISSSAPVRVGQQDSSASPRPGPHPRPLPQTWGRGGRRPG